MASRAASAAERAYVCMAPPLGSSFAIGVSEPLSNSSHLWPQQSIKFDMFETEVKVSKQLCKEVCQRL